MNTTFDATKTNFSPMKIYASQKNFVEAQHEARSNEKINLIETKITTLVVKKLNTITQQCFHFSLTSCLIDHCMG
jgi:uncharacterized protein YqkB